MPTYIQISQAGDFTAFCKNRAAATSRAMQACGFIEPELLALLVGQRTQSVPAAKVPTALKGRCEQVIRMDPAGRA